APPEEQVDFDPVTLLEPAGGLRCLDSHIVLGSAYFDLYFLGFRYLYLRFHLLVLLVLFVLEFAVISYTADRGLGIRRYFDEIEAGFDSLGKRFLGGEDAE